MDGILNGVVIVLFGKAFCFCIKFGAILFCPPVTQSAILIILAAVIIKAFLHFVPEDRIDASIINSIIGICIKERELQNTCREHDLI